MTKQRILDVSGQQCIYCIQCKLTKHIEHMNSENSNFVFIKIKRMQCCSIVTHTVLGSQAKNSSKSKQQSNFKTGHTNYDINYAQYLKWAKQKIAQQVFCAVFILKM